MVCRRSFLFKVYNKVSFYLSIVHSALRESGKTPIVWQEMVLTHDLPLENDTIVMVWISSQDVQKVVEKNFRVIHAASDYFYLDCGTGGWLGNTISTSWCDPYKTWQKAYSFDPYLNVPPEQQHLILGGEALLWSEQADSMNLDSLAWLVFSFSPSRNLREESERKFFIGLEQLQLQKYFGLDQLSQVEL